MDDEADNGALPLDGVQLDAVELIEAVMRGDVAATHVCANLVAIKAEYHGLEAVSAAARDVLQNLGTQAGSQQPGLGRALTSLIELLNPQPE